MLLVLGARGSAKAKGKRTATEHSHSGTPSAAPRSWAPHEMATVPPLSGLRAPLEVPALPLVQPAGALPEPQREAADRREKGHAVIWEAGGDQGCGRFALRPEP